MITVEKKNKNKNKNKKKTNVVTLLAKRIEYNMDGPKRYYI